jgi:hypothetical protein
MMEIPVLGLGFYWQQKTIEPLAEPLLQVACSVFGVQVLAEPPLEGRKPLTETFVCP